MKYRARALRLAAQAWCQEKTSAKVMDTDLAEAFANILETETLNLRHRLARMKQDRDNWRKQITARGGQMSLRYEQYRALLYTRQFLFDCLDPKKRPKTAKELRQRVSLCLHHFPPLMDNGEPIFNEEHYGRKKGK